MMQEATSNLSPVEIGEFSNINWFDENTGRSDLKTEVRILKR